jgi:tRNA (Thr-GGU) A37 N-methylase
MEVAHELIVITWLHEAKRGVLKNHPRSDASCLPTGVFYRRSPARPNPLGIHAVIVREVNGLRLKIGPIECFSTGRPWWTSSQRQRGRMIERATRESRQLSPLESRH